LSGGLFDLYLLDSSLKRRSVAPAGALETNSASGEGLTPPRYTLSPLPWLVSASLYVEQ